MRSLSEAPKIENGMAPKEAKIRPAGIITPAELMGQRIEEPPGLHIQDSPIHSWLITKPDGRREIFGFMPEEKLASRIFLKFLHHLAPVNDFDPDLENVVVDYKQMDRVDSYFDPGLHQRHAVTLRQHWADFMEHFPQYLRTFQEEDEVIIKSILSRGKITSDQITLGSVRLPGQTWTSKNPVVLSRYGSDKRSGKTELQREFTESDPDAIDERLRTYYKDDDPTRIPLRAYLTDTAVVIQFNNTLHAEIPFDVLDAKGEYDLSKIRISSTNIIIPTFRLLLDDESNPTWNPSHADDLDHLKKINQFTNTFNLPEGLSLDPSRFDSLAGGLAFAYLSGDKRGHWASYHTFTHGRRFKAMEAVQVAVQALQHRDEIPKLPFAKKYLDHVLATAA